MFGNLVIFILISIGISVNSEEVNLDQEIVTGHYNFALNFNKLLYKSLESDKDYVLHSPVNVYAALAVVGYGSGGKTKEELINLLGLPKSYEWDKVHTKLANTFIQAQANKNANMTIAEGIFVQDGFQIKEQFKKFAEEIYKAKIVNVNFAKNGQQTLDIINSWVSDNTGGRIKKIRDEPYTPDTLLVAANALFFHAKWQEKFKEYNSFPGNFNYNGQVTQVKYMSEDGYIQYYEDGESKFKAVGIPYEDSEFAIYYILPDEDTTLQSVIDKFSKDHIAKLISATTNNVEYKIPQMELAYEANLEDHLKVLGVHDLFTGDANLENLASGIQVSKVTHKVELKVNEEGTIGSAVTVIGIVGASLPIHTVQPKHFIVNRPFLFFIHHKNTNMVIFLGSVRKPAPIKNV